MAQSSIESAVCAGISDWDGIRTPIKTFSTCSPKKLKLTLVLCSINIETTVMACCYHNVAVA